MSWVPPVSRDGFFHSGASFYVEVDHHRHPRCDSGALYKLLTWTDPPPLLTKKGIVAKRQPDPHKDSPGHFYQAQCLHYGLKGYKQKPAAKKHLLAAFNATTKDMAVPPHILALEKSLNEEYKAVNEVAMQKAKEEEVRQEKMYQIERKRMQGEREKERQKEREGADGMLNEFAAAGITISQGKIAGTQSDNEVSPTKSKKVSEAELRKDIAALSETQLRAMIEKLVFDKKVQTFKKAAVKELDALKKAQAANAKVPKGKGKGKVATLAETMDDEGEYLVTAPYLRDGWGDGYQTMKLKMSGSPGRSHQWVWFHFGIISGIMRSRGLLPEHVGDKTHFHWRGREEGEGEMTYGSDNTASITFVGGGRIRGRMRWNGQLFEFIGKKVPRQNIIWSRSVRSWKDEYNGINDRSYEHARTARWGGGGGWYGGDDSGDASSNSDTVGDPYAEGSEDEASEGFGLNCAY
ncbi:hypothetical protein GALMADRAFT_204831 [Galerina marginata CBS 339.88]|uniref:Uncharacterized protein n=1 Tax=Galerina marginata (strain CBS 339.88) TaxID=685588 RepID=A0A067U1W4_GALM3|nr:hypothetical protein GALMADRAFT_204831 [Galerina marginata CBS 339.88]